MRKRLDTGPIQRERQAVAPQPDRDLPRAVQPQTTVQLNVPQAASGRGLAVAPPKPSPVPMAAPMVQPAPPRGIAGSGAWDPTGGLQPASQPNPQLNGQLRPAGQDFYDLKNRYENRLAAGGGGQQFLDRHPRFAERYDRSVVSPRDPYRPRTTGPQGNSVDPIGWNPSQPGRGGQGFAPPAAPGQPSPTQPAPVTPGTVVTGGGVQVYTEPPPGSGIHPDGRIDLPTGWAGIGGPDGNLVYVQGWNQLTHEQRIQLVSEIKGQDWVTPAGGQLQSYGPGIAAAGTQVYGDQGYASEPTAEQATPQVAPGQVIDPAAAPTPAPTVAPTIAPRVIPGTPEPGMPGQPQPQYQPIGNGTVTPVAGGNQGSNAVINGGVGGTIDDPFNLGSQDRPGAPSPSPGLGYPSSGNEGGGQAGAPNPGASTLTLSPQAEAARRGLEDELAATLAAIGVARDQIPATLQLITTRLLNDQAEDLRNTDEAANARGIYNSGIRSTDRGRVTSGYDRKRADIAADAARQLNELAAAESSALAGYNRSWADVLLELAGQAAEDPDYGFGSSTGNTYGNTGASSGKGPKPKQQGKNRRDDNKKKPRKRGDR